MIVIYLALGCPGRVRLEYDFVSPISETETAGGGVAHRISICQETNGDGISNGLRRLLHLNASDYLSLKEWNVSLYIGDVYYRHAIWSSLKTVFAVLFLICTIFCNRFSNKFIFLQY